MSNLYSHRDTCRLCNAKDLTLVLSLTPTPPANAFVMESELDEKQVCYPLDVFICENCAHVQLLDVVDPNTLFEHYVYVSGTSPVFVDHFRDYANEIIKRFPDSAVGLVVDIGSNDGTLLRFFKESGWNVLGIDPAKEIAHKACESGIETKDDFFTSELAIKVRRERGAAKVVTANNVFAHSDDLRGILEGVRSLLDEDGIFVFEVSYLFDVIENTLFDTIYHEHLAYHSVKPLERFFSANNMELIDVLSVNSHGGSLRGVVQKKGGPRTVHQSVADAISREEHAGLDKAETLKRFAVSIEERKQETVSLLQNIKNDGKTIAAFGAPAKATTLMYHFNIGPEIIDFIIDDSPLKQGLYSPGMHIKIVSSEAINELSPDYLLILAWNFAQPIMKKHSDFKSGGGHFIVPLPTTKVY